MDNQKLGTYQSISIVVTVMIAHIILNMPNHLITSTGSATILNLLYVFGICLIVFTVFCKVFTLFPNSDIIDICEYSFGRVAKKVFSFIICVYLLTISAFIIRIFAESLILIYFPNIDIELIILVFIAITAILNTLGFSTISKLTKLILPLILIAMVIIFLGSSSDFVYQRIYPILGYGSYDTFVLGLRKHICI